MRITGPLSIYGNPYAAQQQQESAQSQKKPQELELQIQQQRLASSKIAPQLNQQQKDQLAQEYTRQQAQGRLVSENANLNVKKALDQYSDTSQRGEKDELGQILGVDEYA